MSNELQIGNVGDQFQRLEYRVRELERQNASMRAELHRRDIADARYEESRKADMERYEMIVRRLDRIDAHVSRIVWIVVTAVLMAVIGFVISGGTANVGL